MDPSYSQLQCRRQDMIMPNPKSTMKSVPCVSPSPQFEINFIISGTHIINEWILSQNRTHELVHAGVVELPTATRSIRFNLQMISTSPKERMLDALKQGMGDFPLAIERREGLAKYAVETAWNIVVYYMSPSDNQLNLYINFSVVHKHILHAEQDNTGPTMIPTSEAAIESLEISKMVDSLNQNIGESCLICLECYEVGCKVIFMPCSHVFHGDCIKTWLRNSHYCPVCRFGMPIDNHCT